MMRAHERVPPNLHVVTRGQPERRLPRSWRQSASVSWSRRALRRRIRPAGGSLSVNRQAASAAAQYDVVFADAVQHLSGCFKVVGRCSTFLTVFDVRQHAYNARAAFRYVRLIPCLSAISTVCRNLCPESSVTTTLSYYCYRQTWRRPQIRSVLPPQPPRATSAHQHASPSVSAINAVAFLIKPRKSLHVLGQYLNASVHADGPIRRKSSVHAVDEPISSVRSFIDFVAAATNTRFLAGLTSSSDNCSSSADAAHRQRGTYSYLRQPEADCRG